MDLVNQTDQESKDLQDRMTRLLENVANARQFAMNTQSEIDGQRVALEAKEEHLRLRKEKVQQQFDELNEKLRQLEAEERTVNEVMEKAEARQTQLKENLQQLTLTEQSLPEKLTNIFQEQGLLTNEEDSFQQEKTRFENDKKQLDEKFLQLQEQSLQIDVKGEEMVSGEAKLQQKTEKIRKM